jgi:diguanylate cyclase (GGDEF)-like protein
MRFALGLGLYVAFGVAFAVSDVDSWRARSASAPHALIEQARAQLDANAYGADPDGERELLWWMGHAAVNASDDAALTEATSRLSSLGTARKDVLAQAYAGFLRADHKIERGDPGGVTEALQAAQLLQESADPARRALAQFQVCDAYTMAGDTEHAQPLCRDAADAFRDQEDEWNLAQAENNVAINLVSRKEFVEALKVYDQARQRYARIGDHSQSVMVGDNMARVLLTLNRPAEALPLSRASHEDEVAAGRLSDALLSSANIARALSALGQKREALSEIASAVDEARAAQKEGLLPDLLQAQGRIAESAGDIKLALAAEREAARVQDQHRVPQIHAEEAELGARYAAREKELRIRDLERENEIKDLQIKAAQAESLQRDALIRGSRLTTAITLVAAIGLAVVALLMWLLLRAQHRHAAELRAQTLRDPLTGVENRRGFFARVDKLLAVPRDALRLPHVLMIVDLDHFKHINDTGGHPFGDLVLGGVVDCLRRVIGEQGTLARLGGEEFGVLCPYIGGEAGLHLAEQMRADVAKLEFPQMQQVARITISVGLALFDGVRNINSDTWLRSADAALYSAKAHGRNRVVASAAVR